MNDEICCPRFDPTPWEGIIHNWDDKPFLTASVPQIFHMPIPGIYGKKITSLWDEAKRLGIAPEENDFLMLSQDPSPWKSTLMLSVTGTKPDAPIVKLSGRFISKTYDGPYSGIPGYLADFEEYAHERRMHIGDVYFYYTTCPKCAKKYGHNYIVLFGKIVDE